MAPGNRVLAITGAFGFIGSRLVNRLQQSDFYSKVVLTDVLEPAMKLPGNYVYRKCDIRDGDTLKEIFTGEGVTDVVHLAYLSNPTRDLDLEYQIDVKGSENVINAAKACSAGKFVIASSDCAYGFFPGTPDHLPEEAPLRPTPGFTYAINKTIIEKMVQNYAADNPETSVVIFRPCIVMGPNCKSAVAKSLEGPVIIGLSGCNPIMQYVHEDDVAEAFYLALTKDVSGAFNLAADEGLPYDKMAEVAGKKLVRLPAGFMKPLVSLLYTLRLMPFGPAQLSYIQYPLSMKADKIRKELGFRPRYTSAEAIRSFLER